MERKVIHRISGHAITWATKGVLTVPKTTKRLRKQTPGKYINRIKGLKLHLLHQNWTKVLRRRLEEMSSEAPMNFDRNCRDKMRIKPKRRTSSGRRITILVTTLISSLNRTLKGSGRRTNRTGRCRCSAWRLTTMKTKHKSVIWDFANSKMTKWLII